MTGSKKYELLEHYSEEVANRYHQTISDLFGGRFEIYASLIETLLNKTEFKPSDIILELAAGTGIATKQILKKSFAKLYVTDNSTYMLDRVKHNLLGPIPLRPSWGRLDTIEESYFREVFDSRLTKDKELKFMGADAYNLSKNTAQIEPNKIILTNAFNSLEDPIKALSEIYSTLTPQGELLFNCKLFPYTHTLRDVINDVIIEEDRMLDELNVEHNFHPDNTDIPPKYSKEKIEKMLREAGFTVCCSEEKIVHLDKNSALHYLNCSKKRIEEAFDLNNGSTRQQLKTKIERIFNYNYINSPNFIT
ncbi:methyltransferase domain-containing protein, partial [Candidatus Woesearchaeota archaeon]|nr:methyltransferase domain-containing protein [Candidatus Woesearchaeota archaeon]